nr:3,4-dihydroxy-2-butanone-4-phosphate synthase [Ameyamaea chiangmaiensis]
MTTDTAPKAGTALAAAVAALKSGGMIIVVDDEDRENEGDLVMAADHVTAGAITFMVTQGRGLVCLPMDHAMANRLDLPPMVRDNTCRRGTAFTVSIEAMEGVTTGISAADRAHTIRTAVAAGTVPSDLARPGHIFPLRADPGGVLVRAGHTEASVELAVMAGCSPAAVICEIMNDDGTMARMDDLRVFARAHDLPIVSIAELVAFARATMVNGRAALQPRVVAVAEAALPSLHGGDGWRAHAFRDADGQEHLALVHGCVDDGVPLVRLHSECLTGDALGSLRCDCGAQLQQAMRLIAGQPAGIVLYLRGHEGRGIGLANKIRAYALQDDGADTVDANRHLGFADDAREWSVAVAILRTLGVRTLDLLTNNPAKRDALTAHGLEVRRRVPIQTPPNPFNRAYLATKSARMGHALPALAQGCLS